MKERNLYAVPALLLAALCLRCVVVTAQTVRFADDGTWHIASGPVTMTVDAACGGKILSFKYGEKEVISQTSFPNSFGSTFWTSPQSEWSWPPVPEIDADPYEARVEGRTLVLTGRKSERFGYRVSKCFSVDPSDGAVLVTYSILNESDRTRQVAPWEITRVPNGGLIFFDADRVEGSNRMEPLPFVFEKRAAWYAVDVAEKNRKTNADGKGWLAFSNDGLMLVKTFPDLDASQPAPAEAEIQIYVNAGKTYVEIEEQGAYTTLAPGEQLDWTVRWYLIPQTLPSVPDEALLEPVRKIIR